MNDWLAVPREWFSTFGEISKFAGRILGEGPGTVPELVRLLRDEAKVI